MITTLIYGVGRYLETNFSGMRIRIFFPRIRIRLSWIKNPDPTLISNEEKKHSYILGR